MAYELTLARIAFQRQAPIPVEHKGVHLDCGNRVGLLGDKTLIIEFRSVSRVLGIHDAQLLTDLKLPGVQVGLPINFNVELLKDGIKRLVP